MRDILVLSIVLVAAVCALRRPWIGIMLWTWLSVMNPHRFTFGYAYDAPLATVAVACTLIGMLIERRVYNPFQSSLPVLLLVLMAWITLSWLFGLSVADDYEQWTKVMKIYFMTFVALAVLKTKLHIIALAWVLALSVGLLGLKGGLFTIASGGAERVWGPPGSFIQDNNAFALAVVMTIPLLRFLQTQLQAGWRRHAMTAMMVLCAVSALGSQSRGALLALAAMAFLLWARGRQLLLSGLVILLVALTFIPFMPETWTDRMATIGGGYEQDLSAHLRVSAWWNAYGIAKDNVLGIGFNQDRPELFARYSPYPDLTTGPHSIYFNMLGNHGFVGLALFLAIFVGTFLAAGRLRKEARNYPEARWCEDLGAMCQATLFGYFVGGAFLSLSYFDLPYNVMILIVLARAWVRRRAWKTEPAPVPGRFTLPGLVQPEGAR
jgi:putative inorganic carbon (hco3(-)) transporter